MSEQNATNPLKLTCPYCAGTLTAELEFQGNPWMQEYEFVGFLCEDCDAEWDKSGENLAMPKWVLYPELYSKPEDKGTV